MASDTQKEAPTGNSILDHLVKGASSFGRNEIQKMSGNGIPWASFKEQTLVNRPKGMSMVGGIGTEKGLRKVINRIFDAKNAIGVDPAGRIAALYTTTSDVTVLQSTAANTALNANLSASVRGGGGGTQYFAPNISSFRP